MRSKTDTERGFSLDAGTMPKRARIADDEDGAFNWYSGGYQIRTATTLTAEDKQWLRDYADVAWDDPKAKAREHGRPMRFVGPVRVTLGGTEYQLDGSQAQLYYDAAFRGIAGGIRIEDKPENPDEDNAQ